MRACVQLEDWPMLRTVGFWSGEGTVYMCFSTFLCIGLKIIHFMTLNEDSYNTRILVTLSLITEFSRGHLLPYHPGREVRAQVALC